MTSSLRSYHYNILKKMDLSYGASQSVLYSESDSLQALEDDIKDMEKSLDNLYEDRSSHKD